jgi:alkane 1-monooxygenase
MASTPSESVPNPGKHRHIAFCFLPQVPFVLLALGAFYGGYWLLAPAVFLLVVVPLLDLLTGWQDNGHFERSDFSSAAIFLLHWNTRLYAILYLTAVVGFAMSLHRLTPPEIGFLIASLSVIGGIGFASAHELLHGREGFDQVLQRITTAFLFYPHYKLIHTQSHHAHAATDHDKNTAWLDESIYSYLFRTIPQSMVRCWQMEVARIRRRTSSAWACIFQNHMVVFALGQLGLLLALYYFAGRSGLLFYLGQVIGAHVVLESVNYIQHYGLMRKLHDGQYEKTGSEHSWDTYHFFSSYSTFRVGHHSYHHISANPYYLLAAEEQAPKLPVGYFWAIPMVFVPPWWRRVINPKLIPEQTQGLALNQG